MNDKTYNFKSDDGFFAVVLADGGCSLFGNRWDAQKSGWQQEVAGRPVIGITNLRTREQFGREAVYSMWREMNLAT